MDLSLEFAELKDLLGRRLEVIADHSWRDSDPKGHLEALKEVSLAIDGRRDALSGRLPPRLEHFLRNASYSKALAWIEGEAPPSS